MYGAVVRSKSEKETKEGGCRPAARAPRSACATRVVREEKGVHSSSVDQSHSPLAKSALFAPTPRLRGVELMSPANERGSVYSLRKLLFSL